jgi:hypothetical protein
MNYEQSGDFKKALDYRVRALDEYVAIIKGKGTRIVFLGAINFDVFCS